MTTRDYVLKWLAGEYEYQYHKFNVEEDMNRLRNEGLDPGSFWDNQLKNYFHRANVLGLQIPGGRQALAKFVATAIALLETAVIVYGPLPEPGVSSGGNLDRLMSEDGT